MRRVFSTFEAAIVLQQQDADWREQSTSIPALNFLPTWDVTILPSFSGATARFQVSPKGVDRWISVYLDFEDNLGSVGQPYWELYPNAEGDTSRYLLNETEELMAELATLLNQ